MTDSTQYFSKKVQETEAALRTIFPPTPLQRNQFISEKYDSEIYLKREDLSPVRSYKLRGAFNAMRKTKADLYVCASAGNHAQGVAFSCNHFGVKGVIFMPVTTPQQKIDKTRSFGGEHIEIKLVGDYFDESLKAAQEYCATKNAYFIPPFDDLDVIEGQATVAAELMEDLDGVPDIVILPVGGGGLSAGISKYLSSVAPETKIFLVEPQGGPSLMEALKHGAPQTLADVDNFVDGAAVARIGNHNFEALKHHPIKNVKIVPENRICATMIELLNIEGIVLEPAGALTIDVLRDLKEEIRGKKVVCVVSGGNFDFERLPDVKERALRWEGLKKYYILRMPQRPGALKDFLNILGPEDDIARFEYLKKSARNFGTVLLGIETKQSANFDILTQKMTENGLHYIDITSDDTMTGLLI